MDEAKKPFLPGKPELVNTQPLPGTNLYDIWAAAQYTGLSERDLRLQVRSGRLQAFQSTTHGNTWVFLEVDLDNLKAALEDANG